MRFRDFESGVIRLGNAVPAAVLLIAALVILTLGAGLAKTVLTADNAVSFVFVRAALGTVILGVVARPRLVNFSRRQWLDAAMLGIIIALFNVADFYALLNLPLGLVATIGFLGPLAVSVSGARRLVDFFWPLLGFAGVVVLTPLDGTGTVGWIGIGFGLTYAACWALYILASMRTGRSSSGLDGFFAANLIATLALAPFGWQGAAEFFVSPGLAGTTLAVALFAMIPLCLEFLALKRLTPLVFGVLLSLEPAFASITGLILLDEYLGPTDWMALAMVSMASIGVTVFRNRARQTRPAS